MDLEARKFKFIQELFSIDNERIMTNLEHVLMQEKEGHQKISNAHKKELDIRLESYKNNPDDLLEWENVKPDW